MPTVLRPYARWLQTAVGKQMPVISGAGQLQINRQHPLSKGLIGAYLPGLTRGDFTGINGQLGTIDYTQASAPTTPVMVATLEGPALGSSSPTTGGGCTPPGVTDKRIAAYASTAVSFYLRIYQIRTTATSIAAMFVTDGSNSPVGLAARVGGSSNTYVPWYGSFADSGTLATVAAAATHGFLSAFTVGSIPKFYVDGVSVVQTNSTTASAGTLASMSMQLNANPDGAVLACYFWDHALTQADATMLEANPYGIFEPPNVTYFPRDSVDPFVNIWL